MKIGLIGLGKMGYNLALNMKDKEIDVIAYDVSVNAVNQIHALGVDVATSYESLVMQLPLPRIIWLMVPSGTIVQTVIDTLTPLLSKGDIIIDGGNSRYLDTKRRYNELQQKNIHLIDCGTSGGMAGARNGACLMVGGEEKIVKSIENLFVKIAVKDGYAYMGNPGSGHFVKMVHNGIEYGMMQAIGEGFDLLQASQYELDYQKVAQVWAHGSIIEGALMNYIKDAFSKDATLESIEGKIDDSGEGQWMIEEALQSKVALPVITHSLFARYKSKDFLKFSEKVVAAMRNEFGGHAVYPKK
jgi:6-phosphogluconate dehydrogenase